MRTAVVTGITGQDGAYLARLLLGKGYRVVGIHREPTSFWRLNALGISVAELATSVDLGALRPDEFYHLAAQTHVGRAYEDPVGTMEANVGATAHWLDQIRRYSPETRFVYASSAAIFGQPETAPQNEDTPIRPSTPYGTSKAAGHWLTRNYREGHGLHASGAILFNHESPLRTRENVTQRIVQGFAEIAAGSLDAMEIGNPDGQRDWGFAGDYVEAIWRMAQSDRPEDYVVATGVLHSVRDFASAAARCAGIELEWDGGHAIDRSTGRTLVRPDPRFSRPNEAAALVGDARKIRERLGWTPRTTFEEMVRMMVSGPAS